MKKKIKYVYGFLLEASTDFSSVKLQPEISFEFFVKSDVQNKEKHSPVLLRTVGDTILDMSLEE